MNIVRLSDTIPDAMPTTAYTLQYHNMLENHVLLLLQSSGTQILTVQNGQALQYDSDFFGLLTALLVPPKYHWVVMRCNNMYSPIDYKSSMTTVILPNFEELDELLAMFDSSNSLAMG